MPEWAQIAVSVMGAAVVGLGAYWRMVVRVGKLEDKLGVVERDIEDAGAKLGDIQAKSDARDSELRAHGLALTEIKTALDIHIPQLLDGMKSLADKLDSRK